MTFHQNFIRIGLALDTWLSWSNLNEDGTPDERKENESKKSDNNADIQSDYLNIRWCC